MAGDRPEGVKTTGGEIREVRGRSPGAAED